MGKNARKRQARQGNYSEYLDILAESDQPEAILANWVHTMRAVVVGRIVAGTEYHASYERIMAAIMAQSQPIGTRREYRDTLGAHVNGDGSKYFAKR